MKIYCLGEGGRIIQKETRFGYSILVDIREGVLSKIPKLKKFTKNPNYMLQSLVLDYGLSSKNVHQIGKGANGIYSTLQEFGYNVLIKEAS